MNIYRYEDSFTTAGMDISIREFFVLSETPKGKWIQSTNGLYRRWMKNNTKRKYAHETKKQAIESYIHRKNRQIQILESQLNKAKIALNKAKVKQNMLIKSD